MRYEPRHIGSGVWGVWDGAVMSWRGTDLSEDSARQQAMDLDVLNNQYGPRDAKDRREVRPPVPVESASWVRAGVLDFWVQERCEWWGRVRGPDGRQAWVRAKDLRQSAPE